MNDYIPAIIYLIACLSVFILLLITAKKNNHSHKNKNLRIKYIVKKTVVQETYFYTNEKELIKMLQDSHYAEQYALKFGSKPFKTLSSKIIEDHFIDRDAHILELSPNGKELEAYDA